MSRGTAFCVGAFAAMFAMLIPGAGPAQSFFNNWGRCTNERLAPERRVDYCTRLLDSGGGPGSQIAVLTLLGGDYRDMHDYAKALDAYTRALGYEELGVSDAREDIISPGSTISMPSAALLTGALEGRAEVYVLTGRRDLALADLAHIFKLAPDSALSFTARCRTLAIMKTDLDKALADCGQAMKLAPRDTQVLGAAGLLQYQLGHTKEAAADFDAALRISPKLAGALYMRGVIRAHSGDTAGGNADIAAAQDEDPGIAQNFADLGIVR